MTIRYVAPLAALAALLASCGSETADTGNNASAAAEASGNAAPPAPAPAAQAAQKDEAPILLEGGGLRIPHATSAGQLVAFGTPAAAAVEAVTKALGRGPSERGSNEECGGGPQTFAGWEGVLSLWFSDDEFVGWDSDGKLATAQGIALGSPRTSVAALNGVEIAQSSLGTEFMAGELSGVLASDKPNAKVEALWSGSTCVFR